VSARVDSVSAEKAPAVYNSAAEGAPWLVQTMQRRS